ncbi:MAG: DUF4177 domain-containing protein [Bacillota bacterium]
MLSAFLIYYREIIAEHAKQGWRLVQIVSRGYDTDGQPWEFVAIFEKEVGD